MDNPQTYDQRSTDPRATQYPDGRDNADNAPRPAGAMGESSVRDQDRRAGDPNRDGEKKVDHLDEIETLAHEMTRASPSGAETIVGRIHEHIGALRGDRDGTQPYMTPQERALKMPHPNAGTNPRAAGRNPPGPLTPPGVAMPVGIDIRDFSDDATRAPVPVAPASPRDIEEWHRGQLTGTSAPVVAHDAEFERKRLDDEAAAADRLKQQRDQNVSATTPADNNRQAELDRAEAERKRILTNELAAPRQAGVPNPAPGAAQQAERDRVATEQKRAEEQRATNTMPNPAQAPKTYAPAV